MNWLSIVPHPVRRGILSLLPRRLSLQVRFLLKVGYWPRLARPKSFSERVTSKLYYDEPHRLSPYVDKYQVRQIVEALPNPPSLIPMVAVVNSVDELAEVELPPRFVIKATHGSGMVKVYPHERSGITSSDMRTFEKWLKTDYSVGKWELPYKYVPRRLLIEHFIGDSDGKLPTDYKVYVFNGTARLVQVMSGRGQDIRCTNFLPSGEVLRVTKTFPKHNRIPDVTKFPQLVEMAERLGKGFEFVRIDLYYRHEQVFFGEYTFYPAVGMIPFEPREFDVELGNVWHEGRSINRRWLTSCTR